MNSTLPSRRLQDTWPAPDSAQKLLVSCCLPELDQRVQQHQRSSSCTSNRQIDASHTRDCGSGGLHRTEQRLWIWRPAQN